MSISQHAGLRGGICLALVTAACADPSLRVVVEPPAGMSTLTDLITRVEITVYEREGLTCDDIAFRKVSDEELTAMQRSRGEGSLTSIPRLGHKAVVARAYGGGVGGVAERWILAGCTELDEIDGQERVVVRTEPVANAALDASLLAIGTGAVEVAVVAVDARQKGIDGKQVTWTTYSPAPRTGSDMLEPPAPQKLSNGEGTLRPTPPAMVGPYAIQVRVKWATALPPPVTSTMVALPIQRTLGLAEPAFLNTCTVYQYNGKPTLACLEKDTATTRTVRSYRLVANQLVSATLPQMPAPNAVAVLGVGNEVAVVNADGSYTTFFGASYSGSVCQSACGTAVLADVLGFPGCGPSGASSGGLFAFYREAGVPRLVGTVLPGGRKQMFVTPPDNAISLGAIGCVADLETGALAQVAATVNTSNTNLIYLLEVFAPIERRRERRLAGTGFAPSGKETKEARLLTTEVDATGFVVVESVLSKPGLAYRLFERRRSAAVAPPKHYVSGQFDADGEVDLAWDIIEDTASPARAVQVLLGARPGRPPLSGRLPLTDTDDLLAADLDGDGIAEIIGYGNNSVSVQRLGGL